MNIALSTAEGIRTMYDRPLRQVALIGCSHIELAAADSLRCSDAVDELWLTGNGCQTLADRLECLKDEEEVTGHFAGVHVGTFSDAATADIAIIAVGREDLSDSSPNERIRSTAADVDGAARDLVRAGFPGVILVITNPIDIMTHVAQRASGFDPQRVIGLGVLENIREPVGTEGSSMITWCSAECANVRFFDNCDPVCPIFVRALRRKSEESTSINVNAGGRISSLASCVRQVCEAILRDENALIPVSAMASGEFGVEGVYHTLPCLVGRHGVERTIELPSTEEEMLRLRSYAAELKALERGPLHLFFQDLDKQERVDARTASMK